MNVRQVIPRDAIPAIDDPVFGRTHAGEPTDEVIVVDPADAPARAYPVRILDYHEVVNDEYEDGPVAVTWCPLCASAVVYDAVVDGTPLTFGVSGKLADDDLVVYDRQTDSEWKQSSGHCIDGPLEGSRLRPRTATMTTVATFTDRYPDGRILQPVPDAESEAASDDDDPAPVDYSERPYAGYFSSDAVGLAGHRGGENDRTWERDDLDPKAIVLGIEREGEACGVPRPWVRDHGGTVTTTVGETPVLVVASDLGLHAFELPHPNPGSDSTVDADLEWSLETATDTGTSDDSENDPVLIGDGTTWDLVTGRGADGRHLEALPVKRLFAFAWADDHGDDAFLEL
ncbi:DUF3179 domain-containing (seleno)protein [Natronosalvus vescus]|uniref:DUF3179 domain-containing (seleno)protein n=1 Tax=Natronosalvus vescus TaxID=2953881 RepID=UPI002091966C|nr:DUF3179 domain-containing (seleno)protein [Natronosalvus vescus]